MPNDQLRRILIAPSIIVVACAIWSLVGDPPIFIAPIGQLFGLCGLVGLWFCMTTLNDDRKNRPQAPPPQPRKQPNMSPHENPLFQRIREALATWW